MSRPVPQQPRQADHGMVAVRQSVYRSLPVMLCLASPASAHAFLERAGPRVGSEVRASPLELSITFTEGVEPLFSTIELRKENGAPIALGKPHTASGENRKLDVDLPKLLPGTYTVIWHVTSVDTHKTQGSFTFKVVP